MVGTHELPMFERKLGLSAAQTRRSLAFGTAVLSLALAVAQPATLAQHLLRKASERIDIVLQLTPSTQEQTLQQEDQQPTPGQELLSNSVAQALSVLWGH